MIFFNRSLIFYYPQIEVSSVNQFCRRQKIKYKKFKWFWIVLYETEFNKCLEMFRKVLYGTVLYGTILYEHSNKKARQKKTFTTESEFHLC